MPLPAPVSRQFAKIPSDSSEAEFHGPYNKLLAIVFPPDSRFTVIPQYISGITPYSGKSADPVFGFKVVLDNLDQPVFIMELKPPSDLRLAFRREAADLQIRQFLKDTTDCPLPALYGLSAIGTRLCFYSRECDGRVYPPRIIPDLQIAVNMAPQERWNCDICTERGFQKFEGIVNEIKQGCEALPINE